MIERLKPSLRKTIVQRLDNLLTVLGLTAFAIFIAELGFYLDGDLERLLLKLTETIVILFVGQEVARWLVVTERLEQLRQRWFENLVALLSLVVFFSPAIINRAIELFTPEVTLQQFVLLYLGVTQTIVMIFHILRYVRTHQVFYRQHIHPTKIFVLSFIFAIIVGTLLLLLPRATYEGIGLIDAVFTATSAICVTGLSTVAMNTFTPFGQLVICGLIQIGGLGIMTFAMTFAIFFSGGLSIRERIMMGEMVNEERMSEVGSLLLRIILLTFFIEALGAIGLYYSLMGSFDEFDKETFYSCVFHAISAFCNAGFSIFSAETYDQVLRYNYGFSSVLMVLIVLGGLGFPALSSLMNYVDHVLQRRKGRFIFSLSSKLVLISTAILLVGSTIVFYVIEGAYSFSTLDAGPKFFHSLFLTVTSRTAGFSSWPIGDLSPATLLFVMLIMYIGASPASCGGGVKTLNVAIAFLTVRSLLLGQERPQVFGRRISENSIKRAFSIIFITTLTLPLAMMLLIYLEPRLNPIDLAFETVSAWATAGLSRGITAELFGSSKIVLVVLMFTGRIGFMNLLASFAPDQAAPRYKYLEEDIYIN